MRGNIPSKKKPAFPVGPGLLGYLKKYNRSVELPVRYEDLLRHDFSVPLLNERQPGHVVGDGPVRPLGAEGSVPRPDLHLLADQGGRRRGHPEPPDRCPRRLLHLRQHQAVPGADHQPAQRQLRPLLRQAHGRLPGLRAGAGRAAVAQHGDLPGARRHAGRGAHHRHPRRRLHARPPGRPGVQPDPPGQGVREVQRALLRAAAGRHALVQLRRRRHPGHRGIAVPAAGHRLRPAVATRAGRTSTCPSTSGRTTRSSSWASSTWSPRR